MQLVSPPLAQGTQRLPGPHSSLLAQTALWHKTMSSLPQKARPSIER
jgi:hypothetical protein